MKTRRIVFIMFISIVFTCSCKKLNETVGGNLTTGQVPNSAAELLRGVYASLSYTFTSHLEIFALSGMTTDEAIIPTRGNDWDDNGMWRSLHQHKWDPGHKTIRDCFKSLGGVVFAATDLLQYNTTTQQQAEARFLRAWAMYWLLDLFDQVPYRNQGESVIQPARVRKGLEAWEYIISEINAVMAHLDDGPIYKANKYAAKVLLMKCYLNKAVYENRGTPNPSHQPVDMNKVISLADDVINNGGFSFIGNYFDNFAPNNTIARTENIFTQLNVAGSIPANDLRSAWFMGFHYNMAPSGWNGFATLSDFYDKFEAADKRRGIVYPAAGFYPNPGNRINIGFLADQQYDLTTDVPLTDRLGAPLIFTPEVKNIERGSNREVTGIRPLKYFTDLSNIESPDNDFVFFRLPDVLLMKAEAILRGGTGTDAAPYGKSALSIINYIRSHPSRNATPFSSVDLNILYDERGRELWWENWRRQDMIRFGKFLKPFQEKDYPSEEKYLLFPIPYEQLAVNPNLVQNKGY